MARAWFVGLIVAVGCGSPTRVHRPGEEWLAGVEISGNHALAADELIPHLALHRSEDSGRALDPYVVTVDAERIRAAYVEHGFFDVSVTPRIDRTELAQTVVFVVVEGKRATTRIELTGLPPAVPEPKARALIELAEGGPFDYDVYDAAKAPLLALVQGAGHARAQLVATVVADRAGGIAHVQYAITAGPVCTFGPVAVLGVTGDLEAAIRARVSFHDGERYAPGEFETTRKAISEIGRFSAIRVEPDPKATGIVVPVNVFVTVSERHEVHGGIGGAIDPLNIGPRARLGGSLIPELHPLWSFGGEVRPAVVYRFDGTGHEWKVTSSATATRLDLFHARVRGELEGGFDYLTVEAYTSFGPHTHLGLSTPLGVPWLQARAGWMFELLGFRDLSGVLDATGIHALGLDEVERVGAFQESIVAELRDDPLDAHSGVYAELHATEGTAWAGGAFSYRQLTGELRGYLPLPRKLVLAARMRVGGASGDLPITERFFSGGATSNRGFSERALAPSYVNPVNFAQVVIGGAGLVETGVELRLPVKTIGSFVLGTQLFLDGGDVTPAFDELDLANLHWAVGAGIWIRAFGVKFRFESGYRLNRTDAAEPEPKTGRLRNFNWLFGVGDAY